MWRLALPGTTGVAALNLDMGCVGVELNKGNFYTALHNLACAPVRLMDRNGVKSG